VRKAVLTEALTWLRTPYHHRGTIKGVGVDCAQFPLQVYAASGLIELFDAGDYPPDWHMHRSDERYLNVVRERAREIDPEAVQPGDFVVFRVGRCYAHGAIVIEWPRIIHAVVGQCVMLDEATGSRLGRTSRKAFTLWDEDGSTGSKTA
jgi:cell wall-associated NlpC family hydrolase